VPLHYPSPRETGLHLCLDKGYDAPSIWQWLSNQGFIPHIRRRGETSSGMRKKPCHAPRRWVVERSHSWLHRFRRLLVRWEKKARNYVAMLHLACALIAFRQAAAGFFG